MRTRWPRRRRSPVSPWWSASTPEASEPIANAVAQVTEITPLTTPCETPRASAPLVESGYMAVERIVKAGATATSTTSSSGSERPEDQDRRQGHERRRAGQADAQRADAVGAAPDERPGHRAERRSDHERGADVPGRHAVAVQVAGHEQVDGAERDRVDDREHDGGQHEAVAQHRSERADVAVLGRDRDAGRRAPGQRDRERRGGGQAREREQRRGGMGERADARPDHGARREEAHDDARLARRGGRAACWPRARPSTRPT